MGHCTNYLVVDKKDQILKEAKAFAFDNADARENPSRSYHGNMHILGNEPFPDYDAAVQYIRKKAENQCYSDYAVRFYDVESVKKTKKIVVLQSHIEEQRRLKEEYAASHSVKARKSNQIGCENCGSKITRTYLTGDFCPVCRSDLRAAYIKERLRKFDDTITDLNEKLREEKQKAKDKAPVKWCLKVEVHC